MTNEEQTQEVVDSADTVADALKAAFSDADDKAIDQEIETLEDTTVESDESVSVDATEETDLETTEPEEEDEDEETLDPIIPPSSWSAEEKALFDEIPRDAQEVITKRDKQINDWISQKGLEFQKIKQEYEAVDDIVEPYTEEWSMQGINPVDAVRQAVAMRQSLVKDPKAFILWASQQAGVDLTKIQEEAPKVDPQVAALQQQQAQLQSYVQQQQQQVAQQQKQLLTEEVVQYAKETDSTGKPLRPHFETVANDVAVNVQVLKAKYPQATNRQILDKAYEMSVSALGLNGSAPADNSARLKKQKEKVARAKKASKSITGSSSKRADAPPPENIRSALEQAWDASIQR